MDCLTLKMKAVPSFEISGNYFLKDTLSHPRGLNLQQHCCENVICCRNFLWLHFRWRNLFTNVICLLGSLVPYKNQSCYIRFMHWIRDTRQLRIYKLSYRLAGCYSCFLCFLIARTTCIIDIINLARNSRNCSEGRNAIFEQVFKDSGRYGIFFCCSSLCALCSMI